MKLKSYKDLSNNQLINYIGSIPNNFEGWQNYNSTESYSLLNLLLNDERFSTGDFHFLFENDEPICCAGYYVYNDAMIILARAYTWEKFRPGKWLSNIFLPMQLEQAKNKTKEAWLIVNNYNKRIFQTLKYNGAVGINGLKNHHDLYEKFEFCEQTEIINNVPQYVAKYKF